jgi:hypothetical protein
LTVLFASPEFRGKHVYRLVTFISENDVSSGFSEVYKLANLVPTSPCSKSSAERLFSALKRIKAYFRSTQTQETLCYLCILYHLKGNSCKN